MSISSTPLLNVRKARGYDFRSGEALFVYPPRNRPSFGSLILNIIGVGSFLLLALIVIGGVS